jgi:hypothetical protein
MGCPSGWTRPGPRQGARVARRRRAPTPAGDLVAGDGCTAEDANAVVRLAAVTRMSVLLGAGNDRVTKSTSVSALGFGGCEPGDALGAKPGDCT